MSGRRLTHQGFSTILQKQSSGGGGGSKKGTSTKEIARKAVEEEWKRNKKRKKGFDSSDEEDDDERDRGKRDRKNQKDREEEDNDFEFSQEYRDRAKERREGKLPAETKAKDEADALPPPTKGLDLSLARKLRKEMKEAEKKESDGPAMFTELPTVEQAMSTLESITSEEIASSGCTMIDTTTLDYIKGIVKLQNQATQPQPTLSCTLASKKMQRSRLVVNLNGNISDLKRSWEVPREVTNLNLTTAQSCIDVSMIQKIEAILKPSKKSLNPVSSSSNSKILDTLKQRKDEVEARINRFSSQAAPKSTIQETEAQASDYDDDDIFGGLDDYTPPAPTVKQ